MGRRFLVSQGKAMDCRPLHVFARCSGHSSLSLSPSLSLALSLPLSLSLSLSLALATQFPKLHAPIQTHSPQKTDTLLYTEPFTPSTALRLFLQALRPQPLRPKNPKPSTPNPGNPKPLNQSKPPTPTCGPPKSYLF